MGLAGRKVKQRIPYDPRNLSWAENATKFGHAYLSKLGWDATKGLGQEQDGRTTNIAVIHKLDQLGIGAGPSAGKDSKDGVAWKQQMEFERMLARLNAKEGGAEISEEVGGVVETMGFVAAGSETVVESTITTVESTIVEEGSSAKSSNKKKSKDKKRKRSELETNASESLSSPSPAPSTSSAPPRRFAHHRARLLHSKNITSKSAADIAAVLGIASSSASPAPTPGTSTPVDPSQATLTPISDEPDSKITTSTKSMSDYFKEKMAGMKKRHTWMKDSETGAEEVKSGEVSSMNVDEADAEERPRMGLGSGMGLGFGSKPSAAPAADSFVRATLQRAASPASSSSSSSSPFTSSAPPVTSFSTPTVDPEISNSTTDDVPSTKKSKKDKKSKSKAKSSSDSSPSSDVEPSLEPTPALPSAPELIVASSKPNKDKKPEFKKSSEAVSGSLTVDDEPKKKKRRKDRDGEVVIDSAPTPGDAASSSKSKKEKKKKDKRKGADEVIAGSDADATLTVTEDPAEAKRRRKEEKRAKKAARDVE